MIALFLLLSVTAKDETESFLPAQVQAGQKAYGLTVFQGDKVERFELVLLGVLENFLGPQQDLVIAKLTDPKLEKAGVVAGMSGSPVYVDGKLVGALGYALGAFMSEGICGITPDRGDAQVRDLPKIDPFALASSEDVFQRDHPPDFCAAGDVGRGSTNCAAIRGEIRGARLRDGAGRCRRRETFEAARSGIVGRSGARRWRREHRGDRHGDHGRRRPRARLRSSVHGYRPGLVSDDGIASHHHHSFAATLVQARADRRSDRQLHSGSPDRDRRSDWSQGRYGGGHCRSHCRAGKDHACFSLPLGARSQAHPDLLQLVLANSFMRRTEAGLLGSAEVEAAFTLTDGTTLAWHSRVSMDRDQSLPTLAALSISRPAEILWHNDFGPAMLASVSVKATLSREVKGLTVETVSVRPEWLRAW